MGEHSEPSCLLLTIVSIHSLDLHEEGGDGGGRGEARAGGGGGGGE